LDLVWNINLDGNMSIITFETDEDVRTQINLTTNVFVTLLVFGSELVVSTFTMVPGVDKILPQAVIQCGISYIKNSSIFHVDVGTPRGITKVGQIV
jgi:hypothetical protein